MVAQISSIQLCAIVICINIPDDYQCPEEDIALEMMDNNNGNECVEQKARGGLTCGNSERQHGRMHEEIGGKEMKWKKRGLTMAVGVLNRHTSNTAQEGSETSSM